MPVLISVFDDIAVAPSITNTGKSDKLSSIDSANSTLLSCLAPDVVARCLGGIL